MPFSIILFSVNVAVGQAATHAPQETQSDSKKFASGPTLTRESKPRPEMVSPNVPSVSSQARTHREQAMHFEESKVK